MRNKIYPSFFILADELLRTKEIPLWDCHIHTKYTDGKASVREVFERSIQIGLQIIIFTEHTEPWKAKKIDWDIDYCNEINQLRKEYASKIKAYIGFEVNAVSFDGKIELTNNMLEKAEFILGAVHRYPGIGKKKVNELSKDEAIELEYKTLLGLATSKEIDSIAHIGATCSKYCTPFPFELIKEIVKIAVKNNIAIEINPVYHKPLNKFIGLLAEENALITFGSNAHGLNDIGMIVTELKSSFSQ